MKMNKRGAEKIISVYWFVILFLVAGTIAYSVSIFYGNPYDVREIESNILANKIADSNSNGRILKILFMFPFVIMGFKSHSSYCFSVGLFFA